MSGCLHVTIVRIPLDENTPPKIRRYPGTHLDQVATVLSFLYGVAG